MLPAPMIQALTFLIQVGIELCFIVFLLRVLLYFFQISFQNPFFQLIFRLTNPVIMRLNPVIPYTVQRIEVSCLLFLIGLKATEWMLIGVLTQGVAPSIASMLIWPISEIFKQILQILSFSVILMVLFHWLAPHKYHPLLPLLGQITEPLLTPARRLLPQSLSIDLSPLIVIVILKLIEILVVSPLQSIALGH